ncbi:acyltransferase family protein [Roseibium album]|uniref:acyltransferase family protein n=1 Tax=Roseibium album TaxID=311410 RepID=UPI0024929D62|nr:acyltransferase family protein [Roseibium album]
MSIAYRPEINGLRAIAVCSVLFSHAKFKAFAGGFVGVDIFFVISGYLITSILLRDYETGNFSFFAFYLKRLRRLLPALFVVLFFCFLFSYSFLPVERLRDFARTAIAVVLFFSNIHFMSLGGYFDLGDQFRPLLHTWSLGIEEQFYIVYPIFLVLLLAWSRRAFVTGLIVVFVCSIALAQYLSAVDARVNYFLPFTRAWELAAGCLLANVNRTWLDRVPRMWREASAISGVIAIGASVALLTPEFAYPSLWTLIPVAGTVLVLGMAGQQTFVGKLLSTRLLVFLGLISYSLYLWHQPVYVYSGFVLGAHNITQSGYLALILLCVLLATLTYIFVEAPVRSRRIAKGNPQLVAVCVTAALVLIVSSRLTVIYGKQALPFRSAVVTDLDTRLRRNLGITTDCGRIPGGTEYCRTSPRPTIAVWGDSHARHAASAVLAANPDAAIIQFSGSGCPALLDLASARRGAEWARNCLAFNKSVMDWLEKNETVEHVVLASALLDFKGSQQVLNGEDSVGLSDYHTIASGLTGLIDWLRERDMEPFLFSFTPTNGTNIGNCYYRIVLFGREKTRCDMDNEDFLHSAGDRIEIFKAASSNVDSLYLPDLLCSETGCRMMPEDVFLYNDGHHLSYEGAAYVGKASNLYKRVMGATASTQ